MTSIVLNSVPLSFLFPDQDTQDEERMDFLFAMFPLDPNLNNEQYSNKLEIWRKAVKNYCKAVNTSFITFNSVAGVKFNGKTSLALGTCWEEMISSKKLIKKREFKNYLQQSWSSWAVHKAVFPIKWAGNSLLFLSSGSKDAWKNESYIHLETFDEKCDSTVAILQKKLNLNGPSSESLLISYYDVAELCIDLFPTEEEFELCLQYLQKKKLICVHVMEDNTKIVKFSPRRSAWSWSAPVVSKEEITKIELEKSLKIVQDEISRLNERLATVVKDAIEHGKAGSKKKAFRCIKLKHLIEKNLDTKLAMESNIESILSQFEDQKSLSLVIDSMKSSAEMIKKSQISISDVDKTMDEIEDVISHDQTIQDAMSSINQKFMESTGIFDEDLEKELEELAAMDDSKPMPRTVPNGSPQRSPSKSPPKRSFSSMSGSDEMSQATATTPSQAEMDSVFNDSQSSLSPRSKLRRATEPRMALVA